jgi:hypothetical protein
MTIKGTKKASRKNPKKREKNRKNPTSFFYSKTNPDHDRKPTFEQKKRSRSRPTAKSQSRWAVVFVLVSANKTLVSLHFVPFYIVPGHSVPVISSPGKLLTTEP